MEPVELSQGAFNRSGATQAVAHDISKAFDRVWHAGLHKLKSYGISGQIFWSGDSGWEIFTRIFS